MKVAFVSYDAFQGRSTGLYPPLHLCNLATSLHQAGFEVEVFDYASSFSNLENYFKKIRCFQPDVVGLTCYTPYLASFNKITKSLRSYVPDAAMVVGGAHSTAWPEWTLKNMLQFDYAMEGECDRSIVSFAEMISGKRKEEDVPGLVYRKNENILVNKRDFIGDLNQLPQVERNFLDRYYQNKMYWDMAAPGTLDMMITSRGCPYNCSFCFKVENRYRDRSVDHVMHEFENLRRRGVKSIHVQDDAFTANRKRCLEIADALIRCNYRFDLKIRSRVNSVDEELLRKLKKAGVRKIIYGFESGSQKILDIMNKKTTVEMNKRAIDLTKKVGIACYGEVMIGMPGETKETIDKTISFLLEKKPIIGFAPVLYPLPGTKVYEDAKKDGTLQGDWTVDGPMPWVKLPWTQAKADIEAESERISKTVQRDLGTLFYFFRIHFRTINWKQVKFLFRLARRHLHCF